MGWPTIAESAARLPSTYASSGLRSYGCGLRSLQEPWIDTTNPMGEALYHITIAWAQLEKRTLIERTRAGMERARSEGKAISA